ncbi:hypothetical protein [Dokdonella sp.]|uniref:hypothetical protein n=1 Tax=Dokdonella sp. TaxID=2291710 RepID=UPI003C363126
MLDEYGLRLLSEIGVDVYAPRVAAAPTPAGSGQVAEFDVAESRHQSAARSAEVLILGSAAATSRMLADLQRAFRVAGLRVGVADARDDASLADARSLVVLGESLARELGARMPAQQHKAINWIITSEPQALAASASAKQGLWGEIKRLSRSLRAGASQT